MGFRKGWLKGQVRYVQISVNIKSLLYFSSDGDVLDPHKTFHVTDGDKIVKTYIYQQGKMFPTDDRVRKEGSEKSINYNSIFVKPPLFICTHTHRKDSGRKHSNANIYR